MKLKKFYLPNIVLSILLLIIFIFGIPWKIDYFSVVGLFQSLDTFIEASSFALATICLARSKNKVLHFIAIGYLIIISSDFVIRYYVVSGKIPY